MARYDSGITYGSARYDEGVGPPHTNHIMQQNLVSGALSQADFDIIMAAFDTILSKLPFHISLTPEERGSLVKQGPQGIAFVQAMHGLALQNPGSLPADLNMVEFGKDVALFPQLMQIDQKAKQVFETIGDTFMAGGSDGMLTAQLIYAVMKVLNKTGATDVNLDDAGRRFTKRRKKPAGGGTPPTPPA